MRPQSARFLRTLLLFAFFSLLLPFSGIAQTPPTPSRITQAVDEANLTLLKGNTYYLARAKYDSGAAPSSLPMARMLLVLQRSPQQESALEQLLDQQQDQSLIRTSRKSPPGCNPTDSRSRPYPTAAP
jgi:hypothetical protein